MGGQDVIGNQHQDGDWEANNWQPLYIPFTSVPGPTDSVNIERDEPIKFFELFLTDEFVLKLVDQTNLYADQSIEQQQRLNAQKEHSRSKAWKPVTVQDIRKFLGLMFLTGIITKPELQQYWSTDELILTPMFSKVMSRNRFEIILSYFHFNDNSQRPADCTDRLYKVRPILDHMLTKFRELYTPGQNISIDEGMLSWRGRLGFKVYNKEKPIKYGIKSYVLTDSATSYCWQLKTYCGVAASLEETILTLLGNLTNKGYHLFMDNLYNSVRLSKRLLELGTHVCGTLRKNRGEPPAVHNASTSNMQVGDVIALHKENVLCVAWRDKRVVKAITTIGENGMVEVNVKQRGVPGGRIAKMKPTCITLYNTYMNGVDKLDQCIGYYPFTRKSVKWTKKFFFYILQIAMYNAYVLYKCKLQSPQCKSLSDFITSVIRSMIKMEDEEGNIVPVDEDAAVITPRTPTNDPATRLDGIMRNHSLKLIVGNGNKLYHTRVCRVCKKKGLRSETRYICGSCNIPLHKGACFTNYHSLRKYY
ncbi:piggyBac transposable element-derived protein 4-like [Antedon mediterranea]|uniref:piggyBac transposable element-derived protein 4-like n=1 Tax=Antedon mediterranea TaxID=105859 RepID=UPI003AF8A30E